MRKGIFRYNFVFGRVQQPKKILVGLVPDKHYKERNEVKLTVLTCFFL